ncbi:hypothetical protein B5C26_20690 [Photorhabdus luminescens]|uniref:hypothetical protein n=1 Tax=Photorhabdus luminescens TaxID=29488 RepID=UPI000B4D1B6E|nr:hypothetical protein [Photorhabdus luminescens]OWO79588.1 hypothetical protein B5C26_20690 [Photorhabdus luminescens]
MDSGDDRRHKNDDRKDNRHFQKMTAQIQQLASELLCRIESYNLASVEQELIIIRYELQDYQELLIKIPQRQ